VKALSTSTLFAISETKRSQGSPLLSSRILALREAGAQAR